MSKKPTIAAGAVAAGGAGAMGVASYTSADIETAMSDAITKAHADGVTDPVEVRALMAEARKAVVQGA
jgi:hypothetical protein